MAITSMTLGAIAALLEGRLIGDPEQEVTSIAPVEAAHPGAISFISNKKYISQLAETAASAVLVSPDLAEMERSEGTALIILPDPYLAFAKLLQHWSARPRVVTGVSPQAFVHPEAELGSEVNLAPFVYVGARAKVGARADLHPGAYVGADARIGEDVVLGPNAVVHHDCEVGARCFIYAGAVVGSDGFGFAPDLLHGLHEKIPQVGKVVIEDDVEVGANVTIDRAVLGETRIGQGTKIDNLVQVAHNTQIGRGCFLVAQVGISGSSQIGDGVTIGGQAGISGHVKIGDGAKIAGQAGIHSDVAPGAEMIGSPAAEGPKAMRSFASLRTLPDLRSRLRKLERRIAALEPSADDAAEGE